MFRNMVTSLLKHSRITTTEAKAKELRRWVDHIITLAKRGDLHARRLAMAVVREKTVVHKVFEEAATRFGTINGGYTRIVKIGRRAGDAAPLTIVELCSSDVATPTKKKKAKKRSQATPVAAPESKKTPVAAPEAPAAEAPAAEVTQPPEPAAAAPESEAIPADVGAEKDPRPGADPNESGK